MSNRYIHEVIKITNHHKNVSQNYNEKSLHTVLRWLHKREEFTHDNKDDGVKEPLSTLGRNVNWSSYYDKHSRRSSKYSTI